MFFSVRRLEIPGQNRLLLPQPINEPTRLHLINIGLPTVSLRFSSSRPRLRASQHWVSSVVSLPLPTKFLPWTPVKIEAFEPLEEKNCCSAAPSSPHRTPSPNHPEAVCPGNPVASSPRSALLGNPILSSRLNSFSLFHQIPSIPHVTAAALGVVDIVHSFLEHFWQLITPTDEARSYLSHTRSLFSPPSPHHARAAVPSSRRPRAFVTAADLPAPQYFLHDHGKVIAISTWPSTSTGRR